MKIIFSLVLLLNALAATAQQESYQQFQEKAKTSINLQPEYGNVKKDAGYIATDNEFIATALKEDTTREKASDHLIRLGFKYLYSGDLETAMKRFNQAWLLSPKNSDVYWGYGAVYATFNDYPAAFTQYDKGLVMNPKNAKILTDKGTLYLVGYQRDGDSQKITTALTLLNQSFNADSGNVNTAYKLSICYYLTKDCVNARKFYQQCERLGGQPIARDYADALKAMCPN